MKVRLFTIPNLLTLANLVCGSVGVVMALSGGRLTTAFCLMILAAVFDFFDGFVARLLGQSSPIGLQLDSLSDDISFGLLPASILYVLYGRMPSLWLGEGPAAEAAAYAVFVVAAFAALRLAKFNIDDTQRTEFCGLPRRPQRCSAGRWDCWPSGTDSCFRARRSWPWPRPRRG